MPSPEKIKAFKEAIDHSEIENIKAQASADPELLTVNLQDGDQVLHYAIKVSSKAVVTALIELKSPLDEKNAAGMTPLGLAIDEDEADCAFVLIKAGADLHKPYGDPEQVPLERIEAEDDFPKREPILGIALFQAIRQQNHVELARILQTEHYNDAIQNYTDDNGNTALHMAALYAKSLESRILYKEFIDRDVNVVKQNKEGKYAIELLPLKPSHTVIKHSMADIMLAYAITKPNVNEEERIALAKHALECGAWVNRPRDDKSLLHFAVENKHVGIVELLLAHGAEPNAVSATGQSVLVLAINDKALLELLLKNGVNPWLRHDSGQTVLAFFKSSSPSNDLKLIMYSYALTEAAKRGLTDDAVSMLNSAPDEMQSTIVKHTDKNGLTAAHWASYYKHDDMLSWLVDEEGAIEPISDNKGRFIKQDQAGYPLEGDNGKPIKLTVEDLSLPREEDALDAVLYKFGRRSKVASPSSGIMLSTVSAEMPLSQSSLSSGGVLNLMAPYVKDPDVASDLCKMLSPKHTSVKTSKTSVTIFRKKREPLVKIGKERCRMSATLTKEDRHAAVRHIVESFKLAILQQPAGLTKASYEIRKHSSHDVVVPKIEVVPRKGLKSLSVDGLKELMTAYFEAGAIPVIKEDLVIAVTKHKHRTKTPTDAQIQKVLKEITGHLQSQTTTFNGKYVPYAGSESPLLDKVASDYNARHPGALGILVGPGPRRP